MLYFGYIVTKTRYKDLEDDIVSVVGDLSECKYNIPRLIIGLDEAKKYSSLNGWDFDILEREYPNGDMWTFKKTEKREYYEEDVENFKKKIVKFQEKCVSYRFIDIYRLVYSQIKRLYNVLFYSDNTNYIIIDKKMMYCALDNNVVIGISFQQLNYIGIDNDKLIGKLRSASCNKVYFTTSKNMWKLKSWFDGREYVIAAVFKKNARKKHN